MISIIVGLICMALFALVFIPVLPWDFLQLTDEILFVFRGLAPTVVLLFGLLSIIIGATDIKDRQQAKKETLLQEEFERSARDTQNGGE